MGAAVTFVLAIASIVAYLIQYYILVPLNITYMQTIVFILVIAALVQMVEIILKKVSPALYQALGIFLPLITTNCAVLGVAILLVQKGYNLGEAVVYAVSVAIGFTLALVLFAGLRERLELENIPKAMKGVPIALITAGILAMAFMGVLWTGSVRDTFRFRIQNKRSDPYRSACFVNQWMNSKRKIIVIFKMRY